LQQLPANVFAGNPEQIRKRAEKDFVLPMKKEGCQMVCFQTKNPNLGKFWRVLQWKMLVHVFYGHLVNFTVFCYILWTFAIVRGNLVFFLSWYFVARKIWQPCFGRASEANPTNSSSKATSSRFFGENILKIITSVPV
jgi:hypothetical protein